MGSGTPDILATIVAHKRAELAAAAVPRAELEARAEAMRPARRDFRAALVRPTPAIISEVKKASPSKGLLAPDFDPPAIARAYERGGAAALSVLTDQRFFQGSLADLCAARSAVRLPALRKDFTLDEYQILEAAAHGADAILLIVAILPEADLRRLREFAEGLGLAALVEVRDRNELEIAKASGASIIGVNNRNLRTFEVTLETSIELAGHMPSGAVRVSESGIHSAADIAMLRAAGFDAFLVGEHLMKSGDPEAALGALLA